MNEYEKDKELNMYVMVFNNKNSFVQYRSSSFNKYKDKNWQERYKENNTFYMWVKFIGEIGTENLVRFRKDTQEIASVSVDSEGRLSYNEGKIKTQGKVRLNEWNLVGVRQLKEGVSLILNDEITKQINLQIKIKEIDNVVRRLTRALSRDLSLKNEREIENNYKLQKEYLDERIEALKEYLRK